MKMIYCITALLLRECVRPNRRNTNPNRIAQGFAIEINKIIERRNSENHENFLVYVLRYIGGDTCRGCLDRGRGSRDLGHR